MEFRYTAERNVQILLYLLKANGIRKVVASPGTTNITFVASMQHDPYFEIYSSVDERSAAYIACGLAAESGEPVVITCTGATASRNYLPGLTEAYYRKLPILAVTATQAVSKVGHLIPQVIDRSSMQKDVAVMSVLLQTVKDREDEHDCEIKANEAIAALHRNGGGPVHVNLETTYCRDFSIQELPDARIIRRVSYEDPMPEITEGRIGIFVGAHRPFAEAESEAIDKFCSSYDAVVFCDHTSNYKGKYRVLYSLVASQPRSYNRLTELDLLIHIGEVSGEYGTLGRLKAKRVWRINPDGEMRDTFRALDTVFCMSELFFFRHYVKDYIKDDTFIDECIDAYNVIYNKIPELPFSNIWMAKEMSKKLPENSVLHLGILNTFRAWNFFDIPASVQSFTNVGGFGIDGDVSTAIGASLCNPSKLYFCILGDLAFFYDMNVVGNRHVGNNIRILLVNNGKGVEFRNYNHFGAMFGEESDKFIAAAGHYGNKSSMLVKHYAEDLGYEYMSASNKEEFLTSIERFTTNEVTPKPMLLEVFTDTENESDALKLMCNIETDSVSTAKKVIKGILGEKLVKDLKSVIK